MGLLDSDAEELKKGGKPKEGGTGRKVNQSGLGAFKGLGKYNNLTAKFRATEQDKKAAVSTESPTEYPTVEHPRGTLDTKQVLDDRATVQTQNGHQTDTKKTPSASGSKKIPNGYQTDTCQNSAQSFEAHSDTKEAPIGYQPEPLASDTKRIPNGDRTGTKEMSEDAKLAEIDSTDLTDTKQIPASMTKEFELDTKRPPNRDQTDTISKPDPRQFSAKAGAAHLHTKQVPAKSAGRTVDSGTKREPIRYQTDTKLVSDPAQVPTTTLDTKQVPIGHQIDITAVPNSAGETVSIIMGASSAATSESTNGRLSFNPEGPDTTVYSHGATKVPTKCAVQPTSVPEGAETNATPLAPYFESSVLPQVESPTGEIQPSAPSEKSERLSPKILNGETAHSSANHESRSTKNLPREAAFLLDTKEAPIGHQTGTEKVPNSNLLGTKQGLSTKTSENGKSKQAPQRVPYGYQSGTATGTNISEVGELQAVVGKQHRLLNFLYEECVKHGSTQTGPIILERVAEVLETTTGGAKRTLTLLLEKGVVSRLQGKTGRGGFMLFELPKETYQQMLMQSRDAGIRYHSDTKQTPQRIPEQVPGRSSSSSSLYKELEHEKTTNTGSQTRTGEGNTTTLKTPDPAWFTVDYSALHELEVFFGRTHIEQIVSRSWCGSPSDLQESLNHFAWKMKNDRGGIKDPMAHFMAAMRDGKYYARPNGYKSPDQLAEEAKLKADEENALQLELVVQQRFDAVFQQFFLGLDGHRIQYLAPKVTDYTQQKAVIKQRFKDELWVKAMGASRDELSALRFADEPTFTLQPAPSDEELKSALAGLDAQTQSLSKLSAEHASAVASLNQLRMAWRKSLDPKAQLEFLAKYPENTEAEMHRYFESEILPQQNPGLAQTLQSIPSELRPA